MKTTHNCECVCCGAKLKAAVDDDESIAWEGTHADGCMGASVLRVDPIIEAHRLSQEPE